MKLYLLLKMKIIYLGSISKGARGTGTTKMLQIEKPPNKVFSISRKWDILLFAKIQVLRNLEFTYTGISVPTLHC